MQKSDADMENFTGLVPAIYTLFHKKEKKMKKMQADKMRGNDARWLDDESGADSSQHHAMKTTNPLSDWRLVRQSSVDHLISRSKKDRSIHPNPGHLYPQQSPFWNPVPHGVYAKLKKRLRYAFLASSSTKMLQRRPNKLSDSAHQFGGT